MIRALIWDTDFFGIKTGEWDADAGTPGNVDGFDLIYVKTGKTISPEIEGFVKNYAETKVVFSKMLSGIKNKDTAIRTANNDDSIEILYALAYESGNHSRFRLDKKFGNEKFRKLYDAWIDNSLKGQFADEVLVYIHDNEPAGLVTYKNQGDYGTIGLIAVNPQMQGMGIGRKLLDFAETRLIEKNSKELRIPTQLENKQACGFYAKQGYEILETKHIMHYWKK